MDELEDAFLSKSSELDEDKVNEMDKLAQSLNTWRNTFTALVPINVPNLNVIGPAVL